MMFPVHQTLADQSDLSGANVKDKSLKVIINEFANTSNEEFNAFLQEKRNDYYYITENTILIKRILYNFKKQLH